jgi:hypothetical protein
MPCTRRRWTERGRLPKSRPPARRPRRSARLPRPESAPPPAAGSVGAAPRRRGGRGGDPGDPAQPPARIYHDVFRDFVDGCVHLSYVQSSLSRHPLGLTGNCDNQLLARLACDTDIGLQLIFFGLDRDQSTKVVCYGKNRGLDLENHERREILFETTKAQRLAVGVGSRLNH